MIVFFRGSGLIAAGIRWQTRGDFAHCGWLARDGNFYEAHGAHGVTRSASPWAHNLGGAAFYEVRGMSETAHEAVTDFCRSLVGRGYDWLGAVRFLSGVNRNNPARWFCSELVAEACETAGCRLLNTASWRISPVTLSWSPKLLLEREEVR